jgi:predicted PolB exonuclease-like 3'-5' exonuclease
MTPTLVFDIETVPDTDGIKTLFDLPKCTSAEDAANIALHKSRQHNDSEFLPLHLQRVVTISCALREGDSFKIWTLGEVDEPEGQLIQRFFDGVEKYIPNVVSWNGGGFDLPVLHYRGLIHGVQAPRYWYMADDEREFKWNNYISRYHMRHLDLMNLMAMHQPRANASLHDLARLCGFPGKLGMDCSKVWDAYKNGQIQGIRDYCETDVANTYLIFLRFQLMCGTLNEESYLREIALVRDTINGYSGQHWREFLTALQAR